MDRKAGPNHHLHCSVQCCVTPLWSKHDQCDTPGTALCCTAPRCRNPMPTLLCMMVVSSQHSVGGRVRLSASSAGARWRLLVTPLSPLASGHDDWATETRRGEQARSDEGGGGARSVRGVTSQQSGVRRVMIPVRVMITPADGGTRDPAEIKHPLTPSEVTQRVTLSQTSWENHSFQIFTQRYVILRNKIFLFKILSSLFFNSKNHYVFYVFNERSFICSTPKEIFIGIHPVIFSLIPKWT